MDYYKIKKILIILMCALTCLRIVNASKVFATEAVEVTPTWNDGDYTYQADNQYMTLFNNQVAIQNELIYQLRYNYDNNANARTSVKATCDSICDILASRRSSNYSKYLWVGRFPVNTSNTATFYYEVLDIRLLDTISYNDATLNDGYKLLSVPFFSYTRRSFSYQVPITCNTGASETSVTSGNVLIPCAEVGAYSTLWVELFEHVGVFSSQADYEDALNNLVGNTDQLESYGYQTSYAVANTYDYITNDDIDSYNSLGISAPNVSENIDLTDVFDSLETLMTNENYVEKNFTFSLPGNRNFNFSINPNILQNNLVRIGGENVISIVHAMWYIGLYGWYIFAYIGLFSKLLTGDWLHLIKGTSPITNIVKMSVSSMVGGG